MTQTKEERMLAQLHAGMAVQVHTPAGVKFTIKARQDRHGAGVWGYATIPEGKSRPDKNGYRMLSRDRVLEWLSDLDESWFIPPCPPTLNYAMGAPEYEQPRFEGDPICCSVRFRVLVDGREAGSIYKSSAYPGKYTINLTTLRWSGLTPGLNCGVGALSEPMFHDGGPYESLDDAYAGFVRRVEYIHNWRAERSRGESARTA